MVYQMPRYQHILSVLDNVIKDEWVKENINPQIARNFASNIMGRDSINAQVDLVFYKVLAQSCPYIGDDALYKVYLMKNSGIFEKVLINIGTEVK